MTVRIEPGHLFSQHSLNTYARCPRRFQLKYLERQPWPMPEDEDPQAYETHLWRGRVFHQWMARAQLGLDMEGIVAASEDEQLRSWWRAVQGFDLAALPGPIREAELPIVVPLGEYRLYARYDLLALEPAGEAVIVDWKTLHFRPPREVLSQRVQTRVYLYTLALAGHVITGGPPVDPDHVSMIYWFANFPDQTSQIPYSRGRFQRDEDYLHELVARIVNTPDDGFAKTEHQALCRYCNYRSMCGRDGTASKDAAEQWLDEDIDFSLELVDVPELAY